MDINDSKQKTGISVVADETEGQLIDHLSSLQGIGRATALKLLLRKYGPVEIAALRKPFCIPADVTSSDEEIQHSKTDQTCQV